MNNKEKSSVPTSLFWEWIGWTESSLTTCGKHITISSGTTFEDTVFENNPEILEEADE